MFQAADCGNLDEFKRLYLADTTRLEYRDAKGKGAIHYATAKNHVNILKYIIDHRAGKFWSILTLKSKEFPLIPQTWTSETTRETRHFTTLLRTTQLKHFPVCWEQEPIRLYSIMIKMVRFTWQRSWTGLTSSRYAILSRRLLLYRHLSR